MDASILIQHWVKNSEIYKNFISSYKNKNNGKYFLLLKQSIFLCVINFRNKQKNILEI